MNHSVDWDIGNSLIVNRACQRWRGCITKREQAMRDVMDRGREAQNKKRRKTDDR